MKVKLNIKVKQKRATSVLRAELLLALPAPPEALVVALGVPQITRAVEKRRAAKQDACVKIQRKGTS